ncbi:tRNA 5-methylaminomethyl-2-thiouridine biosynthesis bifunctional protein MnmC [compost metagenome]
MHPPALCQAQAAQANIELLNHCQALQLRRVDDQWQARDGDRLLASAPVVVLAGAADIKCFAQSAELPLKRIRGLITAPLSGELLAAWLDNEPLPLPRSVAEACHPNRFALRRLIRGK